MIPRNATPAFFLATKSQFRSHLEHATAAVPREHGDEDIGIRKDGAVCLDQPSLFADGPIRHHCPYSLPMNSLYHFGDIVLKSRHILPRFLAEGSVVLAIFGAEIGKVDATD